MSTRIFYAELSTAVSGVIATISADTIEELRKAIKDEWLFLIDDGDCIRIFETYED